jgi:hypothetical protein
MSQSREMAAALASAAVTDELLLVTGAHNLDFLAHYSNLVPKILEFPATI